MAGLDNTTANGLEGFLLLEDIVSTLTDAKLKRAFLRQLEQSKRYLKIGYRLHSETFSNCDTHCISFALSNTQSESLQIEYNHLHNETCHQCALLMSTIEAVTNLVTDVSSDEDERDELLYDVTITKLNILEWMAHILRGVQQEKAKTLAMNQLSQTKGFWLSDWAQKILPIRYRKGQNEYFGKKGMSLRIDVLLQKQQTGTLQKDVYFTATYRSDQDVIDTLCVADHALEQIKKDYPSLEGFYCKSDNASCYAGNSCAELEFEICKKHNITLYRHDYNEPQKGKNQADRKSAIAERYMTKYVNAGKDIISADDLKRAVLFRGSPENAKVSVVEINRQDCEIEQRKIQNIQSFHSIQFEEDGMRCWQYFDVGIGQLVPYADISFHSGLENVSPFSSSERRTKRLLQMSKRKDREFLDIKFCPVTGCISTFSSEIELLEHVANEEHKFVEAASGMDRVRPVYSELILTSSNLHQSVGTGDANTLQAECVLSRCMLLSFFFRNGLGSTKKKGNSV